MTPTLRAAVIGASGIGKHHAKWFKACGCEVAGFVGSAPDRIAATAQALRDNLAIEAQGFDSVPAMLAAIEPDLVSVCSPPWLHREHCLAVLEAGASLLCEKPLAWDPDKAHGALLDEATEIVEAASEAGVVAAVNTQYMAAAEPYWELCRLAEAKADPTTFRRFYMRMDSRGGVGGTTGAKIWIDLASHPISVLQALAGPGHVIDGTVRAEVTERSAEAEFIYRTDRGRDVAALIETVNVPDGPLSRRLGVNDALADYEGRNDESGVYCAYLKLGETELKATDFMQVSISRFVAAVRGEGLPLATVADGLANLTMQLGLLETATER